MKLLQLGTMVLVGAFVVGADTAVASPAQDAQRPMYGATKYDKAKEVTLTGTIERIEHHSARGNEGVHILLRTDKSTIEVHVAPVWFMERYAGKLRKGDTVEVTGARTRFEDAAVIVAREIVADSEKLALRDADGRPLWAGRTDAP